MNINNFETRIALVNKKIEKIERAIESQQKYWLPYQSRILLFFICVAAAITIFSTTLEYFSKRRSEMIRKQLPQESSSEMIAKYVSQQKGIEHE